MKHLLCFFIGYLNNTKNKKTRAHVTCFQYYLEMLYYVDFYSDFENEMPKNYNIRLKKINQYIYWNESSWKYLWCVDITLYSVQSTHMWTMKHALKDNE